MSDILQTSKQFTAGESVTHTGLNNIIGGTSFVTGVEKTADESTIVVDPTGGYLKAGVMQEANIGNHQVTFGKMQRISGDRVIGNNTASNAQVRAITIEQELINDSGTDSIAYSSAITDLVNDLVEKVNARTILNYSERIMKQAFNVKNDSTPEIQPVSGVADNDSARYLFQDGLDGFGTTTKALIDDLTLQDTNSKVEITYNFSGDTNDNNVAVNFFLERSLDDGVTWASIPEAIGDARGNRLRATSNLHHGNGARSFGNTSFTFIDSPGNTTPQYRVTWSILRQYNFRINRENSDSDDDGYSTVVSYMRAKEIIDTPITDYGGN
jgi:hypothetical protein